ASTGVPTGTATSSALSDCQPGGQVAGSCVEPGWFGRPMTSPGAASGQASGPEPPPRSARSLPVAPQPDVEIVVVDTGAPCMIGSGSFGFEFGSGPSRISKCR